MKNIVIDISIRENCLKLGENKHKLEQRNDLLLLKWKPGSYIFYTEIELLKLHHSFGHPSAKALYNLLKRASPTTDLMLKKSLDSIVKEFLNCARNAIKPRRFKLTIGTEKYRFNHIVAADVVYIDGKNVLNLVDESNHFGAVII